MNTIIQASKINEQDYLELLSLNKLVSIFELLVTQKQIEINARRTMKRIFCIFCYFLVLMLIFAAIVLNFCIVPVYLFSHTPVVTGKPVKIEIKPGSKGYQIIRKLTEKLQLSALDSKKFYILLKLSGHDKNLKPGEYEILCYSTPLDIIDQLFKGKIIKYTIVIPEGSTLFDIAEKLEQIGLADRKKILELAKDPLFIKSLGLSAPSLEGYLFPDTYIFTRHDTPSTILSTMVKEFKRRFKPEWIKRAEKMGFTVHQVVTLASIVEKEAVKDEERPIIAAVFINRLKIGMPLQSDPTAVYDIPNFKGPIRKSHLHRNSPYNTYIIKGLPPSPICNPGEASIKAVLFHKKVPFFYFVSKGDGTHFFSKTYGEHLKHIKRVRPTKKKIVKDGDKNK